MVFLAVRAGKALLWLARNAPKDVISKFRILMKNNPRISAALTTVSLYEVYDLVTATLESNDAEELASEIVAMAKQAGVPDWAFEAVEIAAGAVGINSVSDGAKRIVSGLDAAVASVPKTFLDGEPNTMDSLDSKGVKDMNEMYRFIRSEISPNPTFVVKYHAMMREFLMMEPTDVKKMLESFA